MVHLPGNAKRVSTIPGRRCAECWSTLLEVDFRRDADGPTLQPFVGCIVCDEALHSLIELKHGKTSFRGRRRTGGVGPR
jgi:DNA topoisomerase III